MKFKFFQDRKVSSDGKNIINYISINTINILKRVLSPIQVVNLEISKGYGFMWGVLCELTINLTITEYPNIE